MIHVLPIVMGANVELNFVRGWMTVFDPREMRCVPVSWALSAMVSVEESCVGGFGAAGVIDGRFEDDIVIEALHARNSDERDS